MVNETPFIPPFGLIKQESENDVTIWGFRFYGMMQKPIANEPFILGEIVEDYILGSIFEFFCPV